VLFRIESVDDRLGMVVEQALSHNAQSAQTYMIAVRTGVEKVVHNGFKLVGEGTDLLFNEHVKSMMRPDHRLCDELPVPGGTALIEDAQQQ
jgi:hypothetical protein